MSQDKQPTVKICDGNGDYIVINECDFCADTHKIYGEQADASTDKPAPKRRGRKPKNAAE